MVVLGEKPMVHDTSSAQCSPRQGVASALLCLRHKHLAARQPSLQRAESASVDDVSYFPRINAAADADGVRNGGAGGLVVEGWSSFRLLPAGPRPFPSR